MRQKERNIKTERNFFCIQLDEKKNCVTGMYGVEIGALISRRNHCVVGLLTHTHTYIYILSLKKVHSARGITHNHQL